MKNVRRRHPPVREEALKRQPSDPNNTPGEENEKPHGLSAASPCVPRRSCCTRGCLRLTALCLLVVFVTVTLGVSYVVSHSPKDVDEQWEDVQSYARWWWTTMRGIEPPCTYDGVRHYHWGGAVDTSGGTCGCWLRRCLSVDEKAGKMKSTVAPTPSADSSTSREAVALSRRGAPDPTVEALWDTCEAAHLPVSRDPAADPLRIFEPPRIARFGVVFTNVRTPMCVQSGNVYAALRPNSSLLTVSYRLGVQEHFYTNLTNAVLRRAVKYHPLTTVPAAGLLFAVEGQTGSLFTLMQEGLRGWAAVLEKGFGLGFESDQDRREWQVAPRQTLFLSDPDMDIPQETKHSSEVARQFANAFTVPAEKPYFSIAPISRTRTGEVGREPMYCFCGGFVLPSIGLADNKGQVAPDGYASVRRTVNAYFHGSPLTADSSENTADSVSASQATAEAVRTSSPLYTPDVRAAWPPRIQGASSPSTSADKQLPLLRPRLLWIGRRRPRIAQEAELIALAQSIGFEVYATSQYVTSASAEEQFYLARYADVVAGFHGVTLTNALWMDVNATRSPCRTLLEFLPYAEAAQVTQIYGTPLQAAGLRYTAVAPVDLEFTSPWFKSAVAQETAKRELMGDGPNGKYVVGHRAFLRHRAMYDVTQVAAQLRQLHQQLQQCL